MYQSSWRTKKRSQKRERKETKRGACSQVVGGRKGHPFSLYIPLCLPSARGGKPPPRDIIHLHRLAHEYGKRVSKFTRLPWTPFILMHNLLFSVGFTVPPTRFFPCMIAFPLLYFKGIYRGSPRSLAPREPINQSTR